MEIEDETVFIYLTYRNNNISLDELRTLSIYGHVDCRNEVEIERLMKELIARLLSHLVYNYADIFDDKINLWFDDDIVATISMHDDTIIVVYPYNCNMSVEDIKKVVEGVMA